MLFLTIHLTIISDILSSVNITVEILFLFLLFCFFTIFPLICLIYASPLGTQTQLPDEPASNLEHITRPLILNSKILLRRLSSTEDVQSLVRMFFTLCVALMVHPRHLHIDRELYLTLLRISSLDPITTTLIHGFAGSAL